MTPEPRIDYPALLAVFLTQQTGTCLGRWSGRLKADQQRALFGRVIGKGTIVIDGSTETVFNRVKVCFGLDYDDRNVTKWSAL